MERIDLTVVGRQHFALPGSAMMERQLKEECEDAFSDLKKELAGKTGPVEIFLVGEESGEEQDFAGDERDRLIGELVGRIMSSAHELSPETVFTTVGTLTRDGEGITVCYEESAVTGMEGSVTALRVSDDGTVSLNRGGKVATNLVFQRRKRIQCVFDSYGPKGLPVVIYTRELKIRRREGSGRVHIDYFIEVGGAKTEHDEFFISWRPHKEEAAGV